MDVRYERLVIMAGSNAFGLSFHPRLTVIAGLGRVERESLVGELVGALGSTRSGVHAELVEDSGRNLAVFRPEGGRHRVVDVDTARDVSAEFTMPDGRIDLLELHGVEHRQARRRMRLVSGDIAAGPQSGSALKRLAGHNQERLWAAAAALQTSDEHLQTVAEEVGTAPEDAALIEKIEQRHTAFEVAHERHEAFRSKSINIALVCAIAAIPIAFVNRMAAVPPLFVASITLLISFTFRSLMERAARTEDEALAEAGAQSYIAFQLQRVNGIMSSDDHRKALMSAAEEHRQAVTAWRMMAGELSVEFALEHRDEITALSQMPGIAHTEILPTPYLGPNADRATELARIIVTRLSEVRHLGKDGESFPLILDEPFTNVDGLTKPSLLELLGHAAGSPQLIFLTSDEDVASWARLEALTGALSIIEPRPEPLAPADPIITV
jgi:hypothetical protein